MLCADARALLDRGLAPGSTDTLRATLGFHLASCAACRAHHSNAEAQRLLHVLLAAPMPVDHAPLHLPAPRRKPQRTARASIGAALLVAGALAAVPLSQPVAARTLEVEVQGSGVGGRGADSIGTSVIGTRIVGTPYRVLPEIDAERLSDRAWLAARLTTTVKPASAPAEIDLASRLSELRALKLAQSSAPVALDVDTSWAEFAPSNAADVARSQLFAFEQAGPQQAVPQIMVDGALVEYALDAALGNLPLQMGRTLFIPDDPQPPTPPPPVVAVPGLPAPELPPTLPAPKPTAPKPTAPKPTAPKPTAPKPTAPAQRYVVQSGDTLSAIALKLYGNANLWPQIYAANRGVIGGNPDLIFPQQRYSVPGRVASGSGTAVRPYLPVKAVTPAPKGQPYTVKKGDSMRGIALGYYGNEMRWKEIYNANTPLIPDPDNLRIGIKLKIP